MLHRHAEFFLSLGAINIAVFEKLILVCDLTCVTQKLLSLRGQYCSVAAALEQGSNNSFFLAEEVLSTYEYKRIIKANDRATMLNLMVGLNGYTLCSGIICEELNGSDYRAVPLHAEENMMIGYVSRKGMSVSALGQQYLEEIRKYKELVL